MILVIFWTWLHDITKNLSPFEVFKIAINVKVRYYIYM